MRFKPRNTAMLKFCVPSGCEKLVFLSITVFCEVQATKHCNAQKIPKLPNLKLTKHCNAQKKYQKFQNSGIYGQAGGRFLKILEIFEHYSVS